MFYNYTIIIEPDEDAYHAFVPALPGCHTFGPTPEAAREQVREAIELYLESLIADHAAIPIEEAPLVVERMQVSV